MSDPEYDPDYVVAFTDAEDDELSAQDSEPHATTGAVGCFALVVSLMIVVVLAYWS